MKYFFDTEFIEHATGVQLVSLGMVREDGRELYLESTSFDSRLADDWVKENVLNKLECVTPNGEVVAERKVDELGSVIIYGACPEADMAEVILRFIGEDKSPEFYAYFASYDWVVFARIFGRLIEKPDHFPMWVIDLKQMMWERGLTKEWKQEVHPDPEGEHNALVDAKWNFDLYKKVIQIHRVDYEVEK